MAGEGVAAQRRQLLRQAAPHRHRERRRDADVMEHAGVVEQAEQQRADRLGAAVFGALVPAKAGDDAVGGARVLDLQHRPLARLVGRGERLGDDAVEAGAFELAQPRRRDVALARRRREVKRRRRAGEQPSSAARRSSCERSAGSGHRGEQVEGDERRRRRARELGDARRRRMQPLLQGVEVEPVGADDDDLAVDDAAGRQPREQRLAQLGEVAIERAQVAALDRHVAAGGRKTIARKPSHFGSNR